MKKIACMLLALLMLAACLAGFAKDDGKTTDGDKAKTIVVGYTVLFQEIDWNQKYTDLDSGAIDCVWNVFTCNTAGDEGVLRSEKVDFSYNYMENRQVIVAKNDSGIATAEVNAELEKLAADGTIATLAKKYGVATTAITDFSDQK